MSQQRDQFFATLWERYTTLAPQALDIREAFRARGEDVVNDHVAFRTFNRSRFDLKAFSALLAELGYEPFDRYHFAEKRLDALAFRAEDPKAPKVFVSELRREELSPAAQEIIEALLTERPERECTRSSLLEDQAWSPPTEVNYLRLLEESEYAAWLSVMGLTVNHFTLSVNHLTGFKDVAEVNRFLSARGDKLNRAGGEVKGGPSVYLEQSSTIADRKVLTFRCGATREVPTCFYEFALRHPLPSGELFQGFVTQNADRIFESTHLKGS